MTRLNQVCEMNPSQMKNFVINNQSCKTCAFIDTCDHSHSDENKCHNGITQWLATEDR